MKEFKINDKIIYYGENAKENTLLVDKFKESNPDALWFHLSNYPSPHCFYLDKEKMEKKEIILLGIFLLDKIKNKISLKKKEKVYLDMVNILDVKTTKTWGLVNVSNIVKIKIFSNN